MKFNALSPHDHSWVDALPGAGDITRHQMDNGITILVRPSHTSPSVNIQGYLPVGSIQDPDEKLGLANFTAAALMRGTRERDFQEIYAALENVGASLGFSGGMLATSFGGQALVEDLDLTLGLLRDALTRPVFPVQQVERLRAQYLTSLAIRAQDTGAMASLAFDANLFQGHPYGRTEDGYPETVASIGRDELADFHGRHYGPEGMVIVLVGAVDPIATVEAIHKTFYDWHGSSPVQFPEIPDAQPITAPRRQHVPISGKHQSDIIMGMVGPERGSPDFMAAALGNSILGQFGLYGRIGESVRERAGLAYYAYASLSAGIGPGAWFASAGVDPANIEQTIDLIEQEFERFTQEVVSQEELEDVKANYIGRMPLTLESNAGVAAAIMLIERHKLGIDYYQRLPDQVNSVTRQAVLEAAQKYLRLDGMVTVTAGSVE